MRKTKKAKELAHLLPEKKKYTLEDALSLLQQCPKAKFDESVDLSLVLGVDPKKSDQQVRFGWSVFDQWAVFMLQSSSTTIDWGQPLFVGSNIWCGAIISITHYAKFLFKIRSSFMSWNTSRCRLNWNM